MKNQKICEFDASLDNPEAINRLGYMYYNSDGVPQDKGKAVELWIKASKLGDERANEMLKNLTLRRDKKTLKKVAKAEAKAAKKAEKAARKEEKKNRK